MPPVAVVVCTRNRRDRLAALLACLRAQTHADFELVVVDDDSSDGTAELLADAGVRTLRMDTRVGPSVARDDGWRATTAPLVAFTDDDCEPAPDWVERLLAAHRREPDALLQGATAPIGRERGLVHHPAMHTQVVKELGPFYQCCNIAYPRAVLERVGGFDRSYDWGGEDTDLAWRAIGAGTPARWVPDARVEHAVTVVGPAAFVRSAQRFTGGIRLLHDHPALRPLTLYHGLFWKASHLHVLTALTVALLVRRWPAARLLLLPYLRNLRSRTYAAPAWMLLAVAYDLAETAATIRGGVRYRTPVI